MIKAPNIIESLKATFETLHEEFLGKDMSDFDFTPDFKKLQTKDLETRKFHGYLETIFAERYNQVEYFLSNFEEDEVINLFLESYYEITGEGIDENTNQILVMLLSDFIAYIDDYFYEELQVYDFSEIEETNQQNDFIADNIEGLKDIKNMFEFYFFDGLNNVLRQYPFDQAVKSIKKDLE